MLTATLSAKPNSMCVCMLRFELLYDLVIVVGFSNVYVPALADDQTTESLIDTSVIPCIYTFIYT